MQDICEGDVIRLSGEEMEFVAVLYGARAKKLRQFLGLKR